MEFLDRTIWIREHYPSNSLGSRIWDAAYVMCRYLEELSTKTFPLRGKRIVELGAGAGLVAVCVGVAAAEEVIVTDQEPLMAQLNMNIALNNVSSNVKAKILDWGEPDLDRFRPPFDLIIGTDVFYEPHVYPLLLQTVSRLAGKNTLALFSYRPRGNEERLFAQLALLSGEFLVKEFSWDSVTNSSSVCGDITLNVLVRKESQISLEQFATPLSKSLTPQPGLI